MNKLILILTLLTGSSLAHAEMGETKTQATARYGQPFNTRGQFAYYKHDGFVVLEWYNANGRAEVVCYFKLSGNITETESERICRANFPDSIRSDDWTEQTDPDPNCRLWATADGAWEYERGVSQIGQNRYSSLMVGTIRGAKQMIAQLNPQQGSGRDEDGRTTEIREDGDI
jgi:hypothetical protein